MILVPLEDYSDAESLNRGWSIRHYEADSLHGFGLPEKSKYGNWPFCAISKKDVV